jgi:hypothetical protein
MCQISHNCLWSFESLRRETLLPVADGGGINAQGSRSGREWLSYATGAISAAYLSGRCAGCGGTRVLPNCSRTRSDDS